MTVLVKHHSLLPYYIVLKDGFRRGGFSPLQVVSSLLLPLISIAGFIFFFSYLLHPGSTAHSLTPEILRYFFFILVVSSVNIPRFSDAIGHDIISEDYLNTDKQPLDPFAAYFLRSVGQHTIVLFILGTTTLGYFARTGSSWPFLVLLPCAILCAFTLLHLIFFNIGMAHFFYAQFRTSIFTFIFDFLSGRVIPLMYFPNNIALLLSFLPFAYAFGAIARHFSQQNIWPLLGSLGVSLLWIVALHRFSRYLWNKGSNYYQEHG